jgi:RNA polymerase sigma-70 factor (ECF subfamily)
LELAARSDDELMRLAGAGVLEAFGVLVSRHERAVRAFCARILGDRGHGDDAAQEVFVEIWRTAGRYEQQGRFRAFLFAAARNRCAKELRSRRAAAALDERQLVAPGDQVDALLAAERRQRLDRLVGSLPPKLRDAIWLRFSAGLDHAEIAEILGRSEETVRSRVFHGLRRLRKLLRGASGKERSRW